jgi:uncharacterized protein
MIVSALLLGFFGSLHCIGMCSPLILAVNKKFPAYQFIPWQFYYHSGRILCYSILGLLIGFLGFAFRIAGLQRGISIGLGLIILGFFLFPGIKKRILSISKNIYLIPGWFNKNFLAVFRYSYNLSAFLGGLLNGLLPCGLVYLALSAALTQGSSLEGQFYMIAFGIGTLPALLLFPFFALKTKNWLPRVSPKIIWVSGILLGLFLIYRGLGLGYMGSPDLVFRELKDLIITACGLD